MKDEFFDFGCTPGDPVTPTVDALFGMCPQRFKTPSNEWHQLAAQMMRHRGADRTAWKWRDQENVDNKIDWLTRVTVTLEANDTRTSQKHRAIAAWILWSMLESLPEFVRVSAPGPVRAAH